MLITRAKVLVQRFYDIADQIDLKRAQEILQDASRRSRFVRSAQQIRMPNPPLEIALGSRPSPLGEVPGCEVLARIYDVGAIALTFSIDLPSPLEPEALISFASRVTTQDDPFTPYGRAIVAELASSIKDACDLTRVSELTEDYTIYRIYQTDPKVDADTLGDNLDIARLLLGETGPISARERSQQSHHVISYSPDELVVLDWNAAVIYDPSTSSDLSDLLELASMQLLELRAYDEVVGESLFKLYDELGKARPWFRARNYVRLSRDIMRLFVDVTEMSDRVENSLRTLGDSWLARLHDAAVHEFDIPRWQRLLRDKLEVLRQINEMLVDQITTAKGLRLETAIVGLIVVELLLPLAVFIKGLF